MTEYKQIIIDTLQNRKKPIYKSKLLSFILNKEFGGFYKNSFMKHSNKLTKAFKELEKEGVIEYIPFKPLKFNKKLIKQKEEKKMNISKMIEERLQQAANQRAEKEWSRLIRKMADEMQNKDFLITKENIELLLAQVKGDYENRESEKPRELTNAIPQSVQEYFEEKVVNEFINETL